MSVDLGLFLILMVSGTFALGIVDVLNRTYLIRGIDDRILLGSVWFIGGLLLCIPLLIVGIPMIQSGFWTALAATVAINVVSQGLFMKAFKFSEASLIAPLRLLTPPLVIFTGFFILGEVPTVGGVAGILITAVGLLFLMAPESRFSIQALFENVRSQQGLIWGIPAVILFAFSLPFDKKAVITSSPLFMAVLSLVLVGIAILAIEFFRRDGAKTLFLAHIKLWWRPVLLISVIGAIGAYLTAAALSYALVAYAASLKRLWSLWTVILAGQFLKERDFTKRLIATLIMLLGIAITVIWG